MLKKEKIQKIYPPLLRIHRRGAGPRDSDSGNKPHLVFINISLLVRQGSIDDVIVMTLLFCPYFVSYKTMQCHLYDVISIFS